MLGPFLATRASQISFGTGFLPSECSFDGELTDIREDFGVGFRFRARSLSLCGASCNTLRDHGKLEQGRTSNASASFEADQSAANSAFAQ